MRQVVAKRRQALAKGFATAPQREHGRSYRGMQHHQSKQRPRRHSGSKLRSSGALPGAAVVRDNPALASLAGLGGVSSLGANWEGFSLYVRGNAALAPALVLGGNVFVLHVL